MRRRRECRTCKEKDSTEQDSKHNEAQQSEAQHSTAKHSSDTDITTNVNTSSLSPNCPQIHFLSIPYVTLPYHIMPCLAKGTYLRLISHSLQLTKFPCLRLVPFPSTYGNTPDLAADNRRDQRRRSGRARLSVGNAQTPLRQTTIDRDGDITTGKGDAGVEERACQVD